MGSIRGSRLGVQVLWVPAKAMFRTEHAFFEYLSLRPGRKKKTNPIPSSSCPYRTEETRRNKQRNSTLDQTASMDSSDQQVNLIYCVREEKISLQKTTHRRHMSAIGRKLSSGGVVYGGTRKLAYCLNGIRKNCICFGRVRKIGILMGEGFILFNKGLRIYGGGCTTPF